MTARMKVLTALLLVFCAGLASAAASDKPISTPSRSLLGSQLGYIPQGCPLTVSISADESDSSWFQDAPEIRGSVTLSNPTSYNVPINNIFVQARSSNGLQYSTQVYCDGNGSPTVPYNPVPYTYGTLTCRYRLVLDRNVFGSYGQSGNRKLLGSGSVQANFFPGSSSSSGSSSGSGGYGYFPPPNQRPTWTVTAIVTVSYSNAQCLSAPTPVNTDCWWSWLSSWYQQHHHGWSWLFGSGRKLLMRLAGSGSGADYPVVVAGESVQASADSSISRSLLGSHSEQGSSDPGSEHRHRHHHTHRHHMHTGSSESGRFSSGSDSGRSLLNTQDSGSERREHRHHNHRHHMHTGSSESGSYGSGSDSGRSLLNTDESGSAHREHRHHNHRHHMHMHSEHGSGSYSGRDIGRSLLHSEGSSNSGSERTEHRHHQHHHNHHMGSEHSGSYSGGFSSGGYDSGRSLLNTDGAANVRVFVPGSTVVDVNASAQDTNVQVEDIATDADK